MTPNLSAAEVAALQAKARTALLASESATGLEKLRLINEAFPFAIQGSAQGLLIAWHNDGWSISDTAGFITKLERDDVVTMLVMLGMEAGCRGSVRETVIGKERKTQVVAAYHPTVKRFGDLQPEPKIKSSDLTLDNLGLKK